MAKKQRPDPVALEELLEKLGIQHWDVVLIGDGSGVGWDMGAGWATTLVERESGRRKLFHGSLSCGTVTLAELMPYVHALWWYARPDGIGQQRLRVARAHHRALSIHAISDSEITVKAGNREASRRSMPYVWPILDKLAEDGFPVIFHHCPRENAALNILADEVSRSARLSSAKVMEAAEAKLVKRFPGIPQPISAYHF